MDDLSDQDLAEMISEAVTVLTSDNREHEEAEEAGTVIVDWSQLLHQREELAKEFVKAIQEELTKNEEQFVEIQSGADAKKLREVENQLDGSKESYQLAKKAAEDAEKKAEQAQSEHQNLLQQQEEEDHKTTTILPINRKELNLYNYVTNIRWDFGAPPEQIKGIVTHKKNVRPIDFNCSENSKYFITNSIWDLIEPDWV